MSGRLKKLLLLLLAAVLLAGAGQVQRSLNRDRDALGLTHTEPLENAPPVLAFTTVALGGFRGLISNALWIRASELQDEDKFFEMQQLADWITKLEPHFAQVWVNQAWNMSYNISVKFKENAPGVYADRWHWVKAGIELLRDQGLKYNPSDVLIHRELAWQFQHKMGANLDDGNMYYKQQWLREMGRVFGTNRPPNLDELVNPQTDDARHRLAVLTDDFKMDPNFMKEVDTKYGPLEWRLPEAHAIYWAAQGLERAKLNERKIDKDMLIQLRRVIYQDLQLSFQRGRLEFDPIVGGFEFGPNLDIIPNASAAYEQAMEDDEKMRDHIKTAHRNMLRDAVYFFYAADRTREAQQWFRYLGEKYPDKLLLEGQTNSFPRNVTLEDYCIAKVQEDVGETSRDRIKSAIQGLLIRAYRRLVFDEDDRAPNLQNLARQTYESYVSQTKGSEMRIGLPPYNEILQGIRDRLLDPERGLPPLYRAILRTKLGLPAEAPSAAPSTNAVPAAPSTNAPAARP
jgi:hypothetical protein